MSQNKVELEAVQKDEGKPKIHYVPKSLLVAVGSVLGQADGTKYDKYNWRKGMKFSRTYDSLMRHLTAWNEGEDTDPESGLNHLHHAAARLAFLIEYISKEKYNKFDDRYKGD